MRISELRDYGDKKTIVLWTSENKLASHLRRLKKLIREQRYYQPQKDSEVLVGCDFYFPKPYLSTLLKSCRRLGFVVQIS